jgi:Heparinase II/III N-terminus
MRLLLVALAALPLWSEPRLLLSRADIDRIKANPRTAAVIDKLTREAEEWPIGAGGAEEENGRFARDIGLAYQFTGKRAYAVKVRRILDAQHGVPEAKSIVWFAFGYDLVRDTMTEPERRRFETDVLAGEKGAGAWDNAALLAVGVSKGDEAMKRLAIDGFRTQLRQGILPDGTWHEGGWSAHFAALEALLVTREMAVRAGFDVPEARALKRMLDAPLDCAFPDGTLPNFSESTRRYRSVARGSRGVESLLWGSGESAIGARPALSSQLLLNAGLAMLRVKDSDHTVAVRFGRGDHLTFNSFANGEHLAAGSRNSVTVDGQKPTHTAGKIIEWKPGADATLIRMSVGPVYPGVEMERTMVLTARYLLDIVEARSTDFGTHLWEWAFHNFGEAFPSPKTPTDESWLATFAEQQSKVRVLMLDLSRAKVALGHDSVTVRRDGASARFAALYEVYCDRPVVTAFREAGADLYEVGTGRTKDVISIERTKFRIVTVP